MARGFGSTLGTTTTDKIVTTLTTNANLRSYHIWTNRNGDGGAGLGCMFDKAVVTQTELLFQSATAGGVYRYSRTWSTTAGTWNFTRPAASSWHGIGISYDSSSTANDPIAYVDGASSAVTEIGTPAGTRTDNADAFVIGNRATDSIINWDGMLAEFAVWDAILTADEFAALGKGASPLLVRPQSLVSYVPMLRNSVDWKLGGAPTVTGALVQPHPRVYMPSGDAYMPLDVSAAAANRQIFAGHRASLAGPGGLAA